MRQDRITASCDTRCRHCEPTQDLLYGPRYHEPGGSCMSCSQKNGIQIYAASRAHVCASESLIDGFQNNSGIIIPRRAWNRWRESEWCRKSEVTWDAYGFASQKDIASLSQSICVEQCPERTYGHTATAKCKMCGDFCSICISESQCVECANPPPGWYS